MLKRVLNYAHELMETTVTNGETVVDGTCGNGKDTLALSRIVGTTGQVMAFDIQEQAIENTKQLLLKEKVENVELIHDDHQHVANYLSPDVKEKLGGAIFNLGYLPGSDKKVITTPESTIRSVETLAAFLKPGGLIVIVVYHGHPGGELEKDALLEHLRSYEQKDYNVLQYGFINQKNNPPFILAIEKKR